MTDHNNYIVFDFRKTPESTVWENEGDHYYYKDCSCLLQYDYARISKSWFSITPLFYSFQNGLLIVSTSWLKLVEVSRENSFNMAIDPFFIRSYLQYQCPFTNCTLSSGIKYLRGGESVHIKGNIVKTEFEPLERGTYDYPKEAFRSDIKRILKQIDFHRTCFQLSSGLDSSILAIMAAQFIENRNLTFVTCITRGRGCVDEIENVKRVSDELKANLQIFDFSRLDIFAEGAALIKKCLGYPTAHPSHLIEFLLDREISKQFDTVITGRGPDECLAGYEWHKNKFSDSSMHRKRVMVTDSLLLSKLLRQRGGDSYDEYVSYHGQACILSLRSRLEYDVLTLSESWNIISSAISDCFDIKVVSPFLNKNLRSGMFFLPDSAKCDSESGKVFMRRVFKGVYPDYILNFPKQGLRLDLKPYLNEYSCDEIFDKINVDPEFFDEYFHVSQIKELIVKTKDNICNYGWQLWSIYLLALSAQVLKNCHEADLIFKPYLPHNKT